MAARRRLQFHLVLLLLVTMAASGYQQLFRISEPSWRAAAARHQSQIRQLLQPGLTAPSNALNSGRRRARIKDDWTALDPKHPIYNFLIEYYGLKGVKGPRRMGRWSLNPSLFIDHDCEGILLEGATEEDLGGVLHMRGCSLQENGIVYNPSSFFGKNDPLRTEESARSATAYLWYRSVLQQTLSADPITHCYGLHEFAMQYQPEGAPTPPSAKYQSHLPLRVDRATINAAVERRGVRCTHVDALRFFAPAAGPLNHHGSQLDRTDQLRLEQPACVHAHMDLLKMALRLQPFIEADLLERILELALESRRLDVAASPYDASSYGVGVIPIETQQGRAQYRTEQVALMQKAEPIRQELLAAYDCFLQLAFDPEVLELAGKRPNAERFAQAAPGSPPWRKNLVETSTTSQ